MKNENLVTIYSTGEFMGSVNKFEGKLIDCGRKEYAQYKRAPYVRFVPKGKRKPAGFVKTSSPYLIVLKGTGHPEPGDWLILSKEQPTTGMTVRESKYLSYDDRYKTDFDAIIDPYIAAHPELVVLDVRSTKGETSY